MKTINGMSIAIICVVLCLVDSGCEKGPHHMSKTHSMLKDLEFALRFENSEEKVINDLLSRGTNRFTGQELFQRLFVNSTNTSLAVPALLAWNKSSNIVDSHGRSVALLVYTNETGEQCLKLWSYGEDGIDQNGKGDDICLPEIRLE